MIHGSLEPNAYDFTLILLATLLNSAKARRASQGGTGV